MTTDNWSLITDDWSLYTDHSSAVATLRVVGTKFAEDRPIELDAGWNLVSYLPRQALAVADALQSIDGQYFAVLGFDQGALSYYPHLDPIFNTLRAMKPLYGYWIKMGQAGTLQYPVSSQQSAVSGEPSAVEGIRQAEQAAGVQPTNTWVNFYGSARLADGWPAPEGALVQVFDADGVACGAGVVTVPGQYGLLACYGDDPTTPEDEGASPGDVLSFAINGEPAPTDREAIWTVHGDLVEVNLGTQAISRPWRLYLPTVGKGTDRQK